MNDLLDNFDFLIYKKNEVKEIIENDEEDINNFLVRKKINLTKEKNENVKSMRKLILQNPNIFVKNSIISRELKKCIEDYEILYNDLNSNYEKITKLFENDKYQNKLHNLVYSFDECAPKDTYLNNIFKIPLIIHKNNEKKDYTKSVNYIKICANIKKNLHMYYNSNSKNKRLVNYLKAYEKHMDAEIYVTREHVRDTLMKNDNIGILKKYLKYLSEIIEYYNVKTHQTRTHKSNNGSSADDVKMYTPDSFINSRNSNSDGEEMHTKHVKNEFLVLKHYHILEFINEQLKQKKDHLNTYQIMQLFLKEIINLKKSYEKIFNEMDTNLYKHIIFLYYFTFSLIHIKIKRKENSNDNSFDTCKIYGSLLNTLNENLLIRLDRDHNSTNVLFLKNQKLDNSVANDRVAFNCDNESECMGNLKSSQNENLDNCFYTTYTESSNYADKVERSIEDATIVSGSIKKDNEKEIGKEVSDESNLKVKHFNTSTIKYSFLNLNSAIFNYIYYYSFFKYDNEMPILDSETDTEEKKQNDHEPLSNSEKTYEKKQPINHYKFIATLYEEEEKAYQDKKKMKKKKKKSYKQINMLTVTLQYKL